MAHKYVVIFYTVLSVLQADDLQPRDLVEEVYQQLFELENIAYAEIAIGRNDLQYLESKFRDDARIASEKATTDIQQHHETISSEVTTIKDLAQTAGSDISSCTVNREDLLDSLPAIYNEGIASCIDGVTQLVAAAVADSRYVIDILLTKVRHFAYQVDQCGESLECLTPLLTQILEERVRIPTLVKEEVQSCRTIVSPLESSLQNCADDNVAEFVVEANAILGQITDCAEEIIG